MIIFKISDYTRNPGLRLIKHSDCSGEFFFHKIKKSLDTCILNDWKLIINMDGTTGYAFGFWEEIIERLVIKYNKHIILSHIKFISDEEPYLIDEIIQCIIKNSKC